MGPEGTIAGPRVTDVQDHPVALPSGALPRLRVARLFISTAADTDFVDITQCCFDMIERHKPNHGNLLVFTRHTTCGLTINEDEEGYQEDVRTTVERLTPSDRYWAHDDLDRRWQNLTPDERPDGRRESGPATADGSREESSSDREASGERPWAAHHRGRALRLRWRGGSGWCGG